MFKQHLLTLFAFIALAQFSYAQCVGGDVVATSGASTVYTCPGDGNADIVEFMVEGASEDTDYQFVVTDSDFNIIGIPPGGMVDAEGAGVGLCYVWGFAYTGDLILSTGMNIFQAQVSTGCWNLSKNALRVVRDVPDAGTVALNDGRTEKMICTADGFDNVAVYTNTSPSAAAFRYVVTDDSNNILAVLDGDNQNFEGVPPGVCRVWGLSYTGNLIAQAGDNAAEVALSDGCFDLSDNFITITRSDVDGGTVTTVDGATSISTIPGDGNSDAVTFAHESSSMANFAYIVTDENNKIIGTPPGNTVDFEGAGEGVCRVWGVSYTGELRYLLGGTVGNFALSTDCFDVSDDFVEVVRSSSLIGGTVAMPSGATVRYTCVDDGTDDVISVVSTGASIGANYTLVVTDANGTILGVPPADMVNVTGAGTGVCLAWGLAYTGELTAMVGDNAMEVALSDGEFALSSNFIAINRDIPNGGTVAMPSGATERSIIAGDGEADVVEFVSEGTSNSNYTYVVTDEAGTILGLPGGNSLDFEGAGEGICLVWGLAYTGQITAQMGDNALEVALTDECFDLSDNFITVTRTASLSGGTVAMPSGATVRYTCVDDGTDDVISVVSSGATTAANYTLVVTDANGTILGVPPADMVNVTGAGTGVCLAWGLAYTGELTAMAGDNAMEVALSDGEFALSSNFITINRDIPNGGTVATPDGATEVSTIAGDGVADVIEFASEGTSNSNFTYVITDQDANILGVPGGNSLDFEGTGAGVCLVWGLAYTGQITAQVGDNAASVALSSECFDLSDNFITVTRTAALPSDASLLSATSTNATALNIYPNPTVDRLEITMNNTLDTESHTQVRVLDLLGRVVLQQEEVLTTGTNIFQLNVSNLADGTYIINIENPVNTISRTFVKN